MPLTVLSVSYSAASVRPDTAGGSEQILLLLDKALTEAGHHSVVVAPEGSMVSGTLVAAPELPDLLDDNALPRLQRLHKRTIERALRSYPIDVVHMHGLDFQACLPRTDLPILATIHLPPSWYSLEGLGDVETICVSKSQAESAGGLPFIDNGVDVDAFATRLRKREFALCLARICPEKGLHHAMDAAQLAGIQLLIGGEIYPYPAHQKYFQQEIAPRLKTHTARFLGPLDPARKRRLLSAARCVLVPSLVEETSSLACMEAFASGTPVIAFPSGALKNIVEEGRTGFLVNSVQEMADVIRRAPEIDPEECRRVARERFSSRRMTQAYISRYESMALLPNWQELWDRCPGATPFQSPDWLMSWWTHFGKGERRILLAKENGRLVAVAPLYIHERRVGFIGEWTSDHAGVLCENPEQAARLFRDKGWKLYQSPAESYPAIAIHADWHLPHRFLGNLVRTERQLRSSGVLTYETADANSLHEFLDALFRLHASRWSLKDEPGVLGHPKIWPFHLEVARKFLDRGWLRLHGLRFNGALIAVLYAFSAKGRTFYYQSGFDAAFNRFSPGSLVLKYAIDEAIREGCHTFEFLRGREPYKYKWGATDRMHRSLLLESLTGRKAVEAVKA
jgi:CelD/BcsL family acetyltransferase involved in cellulose biosynthesis